MLNGLGRVFLYVGAVLIGRSRPQVDGVRALNRPRWLEVSGCGSFEVSEEFGGFCVRQIFSEDSDAVAFGNTVYEAWLKLTNHAM